MGRGLTVSPLSHRTPSPFRLTGRCAPGGSSSLPPGEGSDARCLPTIPLSTLPKPQPHQPPTQISTPISRLTSNRPDNTPVPSHGGSLGRRSAAAAGADGAGATRSQTLRGRLPRGCEVEPGGKPDGRGGGEETRTGPGDGRCHPCPPCAEGPLVNSEAHGPRMWKPVRAERLTFAETVFFQHTGRRPGAPPTPPYPQPDRRAGLQPARRSI